MQGIQPLLYKGVRTCNENYICETKQNVEIQWEEHLGVNKIPEPCRHLKTNSTHVLTWNVLLATPSYDHVKKNLEASYVALSRPSLNEQIDSKS